MPSTEKSPAQLKREAGQARRSQLPRKAHSRWSPAADRPDPIGLIEADNVGRVPELLPIRHARMSASSFAFLRGSAATMAADLAALPSSEILVQSCGDAHLSNFGIFATPERRVVFDINDFDETHPAPFEWDVKRLAASMAVAAASLGLGESAARACARGSVEYYRKAVLRDSRRPLLEVWYQSIPVDALLEQVLPTASSAARKRTEKSLRKARDRSNIGALDRYAELTDDGWRIKPDPPLIVRYDRGEDQERGLRAMFSKYARSLAPDRRRLFDSYELVDFARKVVGVGSVGTEAFMFLFVGPQGDDPLFLQLKQAQPSCLAPFVKAPKVAHEGRRVVEGQRAMQAASDALLGWTSGGSDGSQQFYIRQLRDVKGSANVERMSRRELQLYGALCGETLARAHCRVGGAYEIAGYLGKSETFDRAVADFSIDYAKQNESDHRAMLDAIADGRLQALDA